MSDSPTSRELSPAQTEAVRRMLADARHTEPIPADVARRLDSTLAKMASARVPGEPDSSTDSENDALPAAPVVDLASRRRRRAASLLVAAAAVVALGVSLPQVLPSGGNDAATSAQDSGGDTLEDSTSGGQDARSSTPTPGESSEGRAAKQSPLGTETAPESATSLGAGLILRSDLPLARQLRGHWQRSSFLDDDPPTCVVPRKAGQRVVAATYDDESAAVVLTRRTAAVYLCGESEPVATARLR